MPVSSRRAHRRRSVATWSLRLRPVWSLAPASPASAVTRRSIAVWMSSSVGSNSKTPVRSSSSTRSSAARTTPASSSVRTPARARPRTCARLPARSSAASRRSKPRLTVKASSSSDGPSSNRPCQRVLIRRPRPDSPPVAALHRGPGLDVQAPQADEADAVLVAEPVAAVVGRERVVVEAVVAPATRHLARARRQVQAHVPGDEALALVDEGVERLLERAEPQAVVDQLGVAGLEPELLALQVALEADRLEVGVRHDQRQAARALVGLPALDADPAVLDHVDATPAEGTDPLVERGDQLGRAHLLAVERHRDALTEADDDVDRLGRRRLGQQPHALGRHGPG